MPQIDTSKTQRVANDYAVKDGFFVGAKFLSEYHGAHVYEASLPPSPNGETWIVGPPILIIVKGSVAKDMTPQECQEYYASVGMLGNQ